MIRQARLYQFSLATLHLLINELSQAKPHRERENNLVAGILVLLDTPKYQRAILSTLYNEQRDDKRPSTQALFYLWDVLYRRRMRVAKKTGCEGGNIHKLLGCLCRYADDARITWKEARVERQFPASKPALAHPITKALARQRQQLGTNYGPNSPSPGKREKYGPLWLLVNDTATEVPEELTLFEVVEATPTPLRAQAEQDTLLRKLFNEVIKSLEEEYEILLGCYVNPAEWFQQTNLSVDKLKKLRALRKKVGRYIEQNRFVIQGPEQVIWIYTRFFAEFELDPKKHTGFNSVEAFHAHAFVQAMQNSHVKFSSSGIENRAGSDGQNEDWLDDALPPESDDDIESSFGFDGKEFDEESEASPDAEAYDLLDNQRVVQAMLESCMAHPDIQNDKVLIYFVTKTLSGEYAFSPENGKPLPEFAALIQQSPEYRELDTPALIQILTEKAARILAIPDGHRL